MNDAGKPSAPLKVSHPKPQKEKEFDISQKSTGIPSLDDLVPISKLRKDLKKRQKEQKEQKEQQDQMEQMAQMEQADHTDHTGPVSAMQGKTNTNTNTSTSTSTNSTPRTDCIPHPQGSMQPTRARAALQSEQPLASSVSTSQVHTTAVDHYQLHPPTKIEQPPIRAATEATAAIQKETQRDVDLQHTHLTESRDLLQRIQTESQQMRNELQRMQV